MIFEERLAAELADNPTFAKSITGRRARRVLDLSDRIRRKRILKRMEEDSNELLGRAWGEWSKDEVGAIDWAKVLDLLVKLLPVLLMIFGL